MLLLEVEVVRVLGQRLRWSEVWVESPEVEVVRGLGGVT